MGRPGHQTTEPATRRAGRLRADPGTRRYDKKMKDKKMLGKKIGWNGTMLDCVNPNPLSHFFALNFFVSLYSGDLMPPPKPPPPKPRRRRSSARLLPRLTSRVLSAIVILIACGSI